MFCTNCGKENEDLAKFCVSCGQPISVQTIESENTSNNETVPIEDFVSKDDKLDNSDIQSQDNEVKECDDIVVEPIEELSSNISDDNENIVLEQAAITSEAVNFSEQNSTMPTQNTIKKKGFLDYTGLAACYIVILFLMVSFIGILIGTISINGEQIKKDINKIDILEIEVGEIVESTDFEVEEDDNIEDIIYKSIKSYSNYDIEKEDIDKILEETDIKDYFTDKLSGYVDYITTGEEFDEITSEEIVKLLDDNKEEIQTIANITIEEENLNNLQNFLDNDAVEVMQVFSTEGIEENLDEINFSEYEFFFKKTTWIGSLVGLGIIILLLSFFVFKLNKNKAGSFAIIGSVALVSGIIYLLAGISVFILKDTILENVTQFKELINSVMSIVLYRALIVGAITFALGFITILIKRNVVKIKAKKKESLVYTNI